MSIRQHLSLDGKFLNALIISFVIIMLTTALVILIGALVIDIQNFENRQKVSEISDNGKTVILYKTESGEYEVETTR